MFLRGYSFLSKKEIHEGPRRTTKGHQGVGGGSRGVWHGSGRGERIEGKKSYPEGIAQGRSAPRERGSRLVVPPAQSLAQPRSSPPLGLTGNDALALLRPGRCGYRRRGGCLQSRADAQRPPKRCGRDARAPRGGTPSSFPTHGRPLWIFLQPLCGPLRVPSWIALSPYSPFVDIFFPLPEHKILYISSMNYPWRRPIEPPPTLSGPSSFFVSLRGYVLAFSWISSLHSATLGGPLWILLQPLSGPSSFFVALRGYLFFVSSRFFMDPFVSFVDPLRGYVFAFSWSSFFIPSCPFVDNSFLAVRVSSSRYFPDSRTLFCILSRLVLAISRVGSRESARSRLWSASSDRSR